MTDTTKIEWQGDLEDDCFAEWNGMTAHCECMSEVRVTGIDASTGKCDRSDSFISSYWFMSVSRGGEDLFHEGEHGGMILDGSMARVWLLPAAFTALTRASI